MRIVVVISACVTPAVVCEAVYIRPEPLPRQIAACAVYGLRASAVAPIVDALERRRPDTCIRRALKQHALGQPHRWDILATTVRALCHARLDHLSEERAAGAVRVSRKSLSKWCRELLDTDWHGALALHTWEATVLQACEVMRRRR